MFVVFPDGKAFGPVPEMKTETGTLVHVLWVLSGQTQRLLVNVLRGLKMHSSGSHLPDLSAPSFSVLVTHRCGQRDFYKTGNQLVSCNTHWAFGLPTLHFWGNNALPSLMCLGVVVGGGD